MATERGRWTIESKRLDAELQTACRVAAERQTACRVAAERQGMSVGDRCAEAPRQAARDVLTGERPAAAPPPPARLDDVRDVLLGEVERRIAERVEGKATSAGT